VQPQGLAVAPKLDAELRDLPDGPVLHDVSDIPLLPTGSQVHQRWGVSHAIRRWLIGPRDGPLVPLLPDGIGPDVVFASAGCLDLIQLQCGLVDYGIGRQLGQVKEEESPAVEESHLGRDEAHM
jgi:hypothetical protein